MNRRGIICEGTGHKEAEFLEYEDGPTGAEYAVMPALIVAVCFGLISSIGNKAKATFLNLVSSRPEGS